ncbi:MAG: hypothetical protein KDC38_05000 [Planctomycetes bacterium]|nr:hypothetical protein [Planctomycetota bacterium]
MSYKKTVSEEAQSFLEKLGDDFDSDSGEHGGKSDKPNLSLWLDRTRRLFDHLDGVTKEWARADVESVRTSSRNVVSYGDPKEVAYNAYYQDVLAELKKRHKKK